MQLAAPPQLALLAWLLLSLTCNQGTPDGLALVPSSRQATKEYVLLFKSSAFWVLDLQQLLDFILEVPREKSLPLITFHNHRLFDATFSSFYPLQASPDIVVSFTGLKAEDKMHSSLLAFKDDELWHYKVSLRNETALSAELLGSYGTVYWHNFKPLKDVYSMSIPRASKILHVVWKNLYFSPRSQFYLLNEENLDNPVQHHNRINRFPNITEAQRAVKYYYELSTGHALSFRTGGRICIDDKCRLLRDTIGCDDGLSIYLNSFFFWLANRTNLTYRLVMILLSSISAINFILALSFIFNQIHRIVDLT